jgi:hypothetical protein
MSAILKAIREHEEIRVHLNAKSGMNQLLVRVCRIA